MSEFTPKVAVLILDGYGFDTALEARILADVADHLPTEDRTRLEQAALRVGEPDWLPLLSPNPATAPAVLDLQTRGRAGDALKLSRLLYEKRTRFVEAADVGWYEANVAGRLREAATRLRYAPWVAEQRFLFQLRAQNPTFLTRTSGEDAGFERLDIEIQGNSDTGHQQMFNLCVAEQMSRQLGRALDDGAVEELLGPIVREMAGPEQARDTLFLKTLLSGEFGDDGYVHSCLGHLFIVVDRALALFAKYGVATERLQILALLDGRDSPPDSSIRARQKDGRARFDFLGKLQAFLAERGATACLTRILGRQYMDRNYRGDLIRRELDLLTGRSRADGLGLSAFRARMEGFDGATEAPATLPPVLAADLAEAREAIAACHAKGLKDSEVPPIYVGTSPDLTKRSGLFNLIFRADRQEPSVAALLGLHEFVLAQAEQKKTVDTWDWFLTTDLGLKGLALVTMVDYHKAFTQAGVPFVRPIRPHDHNLLVLAGQRLKDFRVLLAGEGVKEKHVGLFARGRRSTPLEGVEDRIIFPSYGRSEGIASDDELWRVPPMRHVEIASALLERVRREPFPLVAANFPGPDMLGHLIERNFGACVETLASIETILVGLVRGLHALGYAVILTSDHGNVENFGPDHGVNPVLTTIAPPPGLELVPIDGVPGAAKLFDIPHTALELWNLRELCLQGVTYPFPAVSADGFRAVGRPLVTTRTA